MRRSLIVLLYLCVAETLHAQGFSFRENPGDHRIEVLYNKKLITTYWYSDSIEKPVLYPIYTLDGIVVTRGFPVHPRPGERADHPHHVGLWLTYESVNGFDFWNNSSAIAASQKDHYGSIRHQKIVSMHSSGEQAELITTSHWVDPAGKILLRETTTFIFRHDANGLIIDRVSSLTAEVPEVIFKDKKDGFLGLRVARELEMPSQQKDRFVEQDGTISSDTRIDNTGVTGMYVDRQGIRGDDVWGKRSEWAYLQGRKDGNDITIAIIDHPDNIGYPTYWHARGYGLFAANPLGQEVFSGGKETLNFKLLHQKSVKFAYRIVIHSGQPLQKEALDKLKEEFARQK